MKTTKKLLALLLAAVLLFAAAAPAFAAAQQTETVYSAKETAEHTFYRIVDRLILVLGRFLNAVIPGLNWRGAIPRLKDYTPENYYPGEETFGDEPAGDARWSMGFAEASFLTNIDPMDGSYYLVGTLEAMKGRVPTAVLDDQGVNAFALSDGDTTVAYAAIDGYGLARGDVLEIRSRVADLAAEYGIDSINVSALHQHSCIDTLGLGAPLVPAILKNPAATLFAPDTIISGRNKTFMEQVYAATAAAIRAAVENMTEGTLYYGSVNIEEFIKDKRDPQSYDPDFERLRFVPDDQDRNEIWVCETGIHCVSLGAGPTTLTADFPHYVEQYIREQTRADLVFIEGAELAISSRTESLTYDESSAANAKLVAMGEAFGEKLRSIENDEELAPLLNAAHREVVIKVDNPIHTLAGREGLLGSVFVKDGLNYDVITEIGYLELGGRLGVLLVPGEIEPAILWGGAATAAESWTGESWEHAPLAEICGAEKLICFGLCNDQIGYILCDNDFRSMLTENEEINAVALNAGSVITEAFEALFAEIR